MERDTRAITTGQEYLELVNEFYEQNRDMISQEDRFIGLAFNCVERLFESKQDQFWAIVDSYEYLE